ncbi:TIGR02391 family protein [Tunturibacter empetritectus]|uniref:Uncharacterized protein (TIGR02391 family) n=1 Tax=Tunturiibacter empetritectus TaxID=3069691 RepID=A0A7W8IHW3_9BACT|nr:TIGR02391 family protein [Edaphobacter lichenicola]MBB5317462.1 uncharacterized protein (TIGR02391 family) [Edaphobacter lichenicola]
MVEPFAVFEKFVRLTNGLVYAEAECAVPDHPFESRNIHPCLPRIVRDLFDDGHCAQATFEAFKYVDKQVARLGLSNESGEKLMMSAFSEVTPLISLTPRSNISEKDEQRGYKFLFAGAIVAIRNPRGHEYAVHDTPDECLDHLALASTLLRRLEGTGAKLGS